MMRKIILSVLIILHTIILGQTSQQNIQLPTIVPPSPSAQNFMRYGEIPLDYSTGVPKISIPLYTIKSKQLEFPISISYHASGIKVSDIPSEAGIGWVLNAGGIVTRTMLDVKDELGATTKTYSTAEQFLTAVPNIVYGNFNQGCNCYPGSHTMESYLNTKCNNEDLMSDRYFYSLPNGTTGIFRYNYPEFNTLIMLPYRPYKITKTIVNTAYDGNDITEFKIIDDKGVSYLYKRFQDSSYGSSEWFLKEMISADGTESIKLNYAPQQVIGESTPNNSLHTPEEFIHGYNCPGAPSPDSYPVDQPGTTGAGNYSVRLSSIESDDSVITFSYADREDFPNLKKITEIKIASKEDPNTIKKRITFNHSYFGSVGYENTNNRDKRLKLNSISIYGEDNLSPQTHSFTYEQSVMLPPYSSRSFDFWGYFNGSNNGSAIPREMLDPAYQNSGFGGTRKADNGSFSKACMLTEIKYPTGGKTKFDFERAYVSGLFNASNSAGYIGGFRVSRITNYSKDNEIANIKSYQYPGAKYNLIDGEFYSYPQWFIDNVGGPMITGNNITGCWRYYKRTITNSTPVISHDLTPGMPIAYSDVTEYDGTPTNHVGSIEYHYSSPNLISYTSLLRELHTYEEDSGNYEPKLGYKVVRSGTGNKVSEEFFAYSDHFQQEFNTGINITRRLTDLAFYLQFDLTNYGCANCVGDYIQSIKAHNTKAFQKANLLDYTIKRTYDLQDQTKYIDERVDYNIYNQHNLMVKEMSRVSSSGDNILTQYKYPYDFGTSEPYQTMLTKNILTPVIEQTITNTSKSKQLQKIHTDYKNWGNNIIETELIKAQTDTSSPLEDRIRFMSYDKKGNVTSLKKEGSSPITYLWGYNKTLPIAMVENSNLVFEAGTDNQDKTVSSNLYIPMGSTVYELGTFVLTEEKNYKIDRTYEKIPNNQSVMYQVQFENVDNNAYSVTFTDTTPAGGNSQTFTTQAQLLKPGTYKVKLINVGYNGYQGSIEHQFYFTVYNTINVDKTIPFHTSFEEDTYNINTVQTKTGKKSYMGQYDLKLPSASAGYDKVIVSYWGKSSDSSPWEYVENIVNVNGQNYTIGMGYYYIDEVRVYPVGALMTTYTYDPFHKGQTSIMKPNGQTEYYDYDAFGRLKEVYIIEGNVKKTIRTTNYHYKP